MILPNNSVRTKDRFETARHTLYKTHVCETVCEQTRGTDFFPKNMT